MRTQSILTTLLLSSALIACGSVKPENETALELDLNGPVRSQYHYLAENPYGEGLLHAGFIVGIEKTDRQRIGIPQRDNGYCAYFYDYPHADQADRCAPFSETAGANDRRTEILGDHLKGVTDDDSPMFVSHILEYRPDRGVNGIPQPRMETRIVYNIHPSFPGGQRVVESEVVAEVERDQQRDGGEREGYYHEGWRALRGDLKRSMLTGLEEARDEGRPYTHLIVGAMGWDNNQVESVRRYNALLGNTIAEARKSGDEAGLAFNPLFIGITWPSVWSVDGFFDIAKLAAKLVGYPTKADDADEIGYTYANWLVNDLAMHAKASNPGLKVVVLGHSFGSRITSRAVFSGHLLKRPERAGNGEHVDLLVGLQAAFSANRFIGGDGFEDDPANLPKENGDCLACGPGVEGAPYAERGDFDGQVVMTWSEHDGANPLAYLISRAAHMGGDRGFREASKGRADIYFKQVARDSIGADGVLACIDPGGKVLMVDASNFILDHNDMLDSATGRFLWSAIKCQT